MNELEEKINSVLNNPGQLARISAIANSLMGGTEPDASREAPSENAAGAESGALGEKLGALLRGGPGVKSPRIAALEALAPCLDDKRREKLLRAIRLARVLRLAQSGLLGAEDGHV